MTKRKYKVIGTQEVSGALPGETVELDPDDQTPGATNVQALILGGHLEETKSGGASTAAKDTKEK
jgi:hypothetical protein